VTSNMIYEPDAGENSGRASLTYPMPMLHGSTGSGGLSQIVWRGRWLVLMSVLLGGAAGYLCLQRFTPEYQSTARILIGRPGARLNSNVPQPVGSTSNNYVQTQASLIMTREIIGAALRDPNVLALPALTVGDRLGALAGTLTVEVAKGTDLVSISARAENPQEAAVFVNAVVRAYVQWHAANKQIGTADLLRDLNAQLTYRMKELEGKRLDRKAFEQRNPEAVESIRGGIVSKTLEQLRQDLVAARLNTIQQESYQKGLLRFQSEPEKFRQYVQTQRPAGIPIVEDGERAALTAALFQTQLQNEEIAAGRPVRGTDATIFKNKQAQMEKRLTELDQEFVQGHIALAKAVAEDAAAREQQLTKMYEAELAKVQNLGGLDAEYVFKTSQCTLWENLCSSLMTQISNLDLNAQTEGPSTYILERAVAAATPVWPKPAMILGLGLLGGLTVGLGLAFLRDWRDLSVRSADEVTAILGVPVLGAVPSMSKRRLAARGQRLRFDSNSRESEAYRSIRTSLFLGTPREHAGTILVTSPGPREGKTTLVSNLGIAMAHAGQRTLILDADLRKPMQHHIFGMDRRRPGLIDVLVGTATLEEAIQHTDVPGLDVLASGQRTSHPSELLNGPAFRNILEQLKGEYDRILVDSAPVGVVTDAQILGSLCGLTLLVLKANKSSRLLTQRAGGALLTVGARVVGVVVNGVSRKDSKYSHYQALSAYQGRYGPDNDKTANHQLPPAAGRRARTGASVAEKG